MTGYMAFFRKELTAGVRTYKAVILLILFFILGIISPLTAKMLPDLLSVMDLQGMEVLLPEPGAMDSYAQFFSNLAQMGLVALVIIYSSLLTSDISKGTLVLLLTKGLGKPAVILAKLFSSILYWTLGLLVAFGTTFSYTIFLFPGEKIYHLSFSVFCLWIFGCFLLTLLLLAGTLTGKTSGTMLITGGVICILFLGNIFPVIARKSPLLLAGDNYAMLEQGYDITSVYPALFITIAAAIACAALAVMVFRGKRYDL